MAKQSGPKFFVDNIVGDPVSPRRTQLLTGYPGASSLEGYRRLYVDMSFFSYVDVKESDVLAAKAVTASDSPLEVVFAWVSIDADLKWTFRGPIAAGPVTYNCGGGGGFTNGPGCPGFTNNPGCTTPNTQGEGCPGYTLDCGSTNDCGLTNDCGMTDDCGFYRSSIRRRYRRIW